MIISENACWYCFTLDLDSYMNLMYYKEKDNDYYAYFIYQNMFVTLEINNKMYKEMW